MRVPLSWLGEFLELGGISAEEIAERLSLQSVETTVDTFGIELEGVVLGKVLEVKDHPKRKDLLLVVVHAGRKGTAKVVTADRSVKPGDAVILALPGSRVGERYVSEGMLLSPQELGLEEKSEGVLKLREEGIEYGAEAGVVLGFGEKVLELEITPNRGDVLSVKGLARELSAILRLPKREPQLEPIEESGDLSVEIEDEDCHRYRGVVIDGVRVEESP